MASSSQAKSSFGPPRPCAICTILTSQKNLLSTQTLLYSMMKKTNTNRSTTITATNNDNAIVYQPEIVLFVTPDISKEIYEELSCFCTRIVLIDYISNCYDDNINKKRQNNNISVNNYYDLNVAKIHLLNQCVYDQILYIDFNCLVLKDISHLFQRTDIGNGLITAVSLQLNENIDNETYNSDCFDTDVILMKPSHILYNDFMDQFRQSINDGDDINIEHIWNGYFHKVWTQIPKEKRLGKDYNGTTWEKHKSDAYIVNRKNIVDSANHQLKLEMDQLYERWQQKSQLFKENYKEKQILLEKAKEDSDLRQKKKRLQQHQQLQSTTRSSSSASKRREMEKHKLVAKRYKELRKQGMDPKESMKIARSDYGMDEDEKGQPSASAKVASMFGLGGMV